MPAKLKEITGIYRTEFARRGDWFVGEIGIEDSDGERHMARVEGKSDNVREPAIGIEYHWYGKWELKVQYGKTFVSKTFAIAKPHTRAGIIGYLIRYAPRVGRATAMALHNKFGPGAVRVLRESPDVAAAALDNRFGIKQAEKAAAALRERAALEDCEISLIELLGNRGFPRAIAKSCIEKWGNRAAEKLQHNPYLLMAFRGCGYLKTDAMYLDLGHNPARRKRQALCAWHVLASSTDGHTWFPKQVVIDGIRAKVSGAAANPVQAVKLAKRAGMLSTRRDDSHELWLAEAKKARAEQQVAESVARMMHESSQWGNVLALESSVSTCFNRLSSHQRRKLDEAVTDHSTIGILSGAPGVGKTYVASAIAQAIHEIFGVGELALACPTGKAAVRLTEAMQEYGVEAQATTIHRLLGVESADDANGSGWSFVHGPYNPLPYRFVFVDECSMVGTTLFASLLAACAKGTHLFLIGDYGQLPPVEHGAPLRDLIKAGVPCGELTEIQRNAGTIVRACHAIRAGKPLKSDAKLALDAESPRNLKLIGHFNGKDSVEKIVDLIRRIRDRGLADPIEDIQVIGAVNKKSPLSIRELNRRLQAELNPGGGIDGSPFHVKDKVIQTKNTFLPAAEMSGGDEEGKFLVCNGEQGRVIEVLPKMTIVEFSNPQRVVKVPRGQVADDDDSGTGTGCDLALAYAITCHKSQGSEWPVVIVALDEYAGARMVCSKNWIYTALSRAKDVCFLVGKQATVDAMVRRDALQRRKTFLVEQIQEEVTHAV